MHRLQAKLFTVEVALGQHNFVVTNAANPRHLQLRSNAILWHKEAALHALLQRVYEVQPDFFGGHVL